MTATQLLRATSGKDPEPQTDERWFPSTEQCILAQHCTTCDAWIRHECKIANRYARFHVVRKRRGLARCQRDLAMAPALEDREEGLTYGTIL